MNFNRVQKAFDDLDESEKAVNKARRVLGFSEQSGDISKIIQAEEYLAKVEMDRRNAEENLKRLRGDYLEDGLAEKVLSGIDVTLLATSIELVKAFGAYSGMSEDWFVRLDDKPSLKSARKFKGLAKKGRSIHPLFCPFEVCNWISDPRRKIGQKVSKETAWRKFQEHFPLCYEKFKAYDPR